MLVYRVDRLHDQICLRRLLPDHFDGVRDVFQQFLFRHTLANIVCADEHHDVARPEWYDSVVEAVFHVSACFRADAAVVDEASGLLGKGAVGLRHRVIFCDGIPQKDGLAGEGGCVGGCKIILLDIELRFVEAVEIFHAENDKQDHGDQQDGRNRGGEQDGFAFFHNDFPF